MQQTQDQAPPRTTSAFVIVLATIGGLALFFMVILFSLAFLLGRAGVSGPVVGGADKIGVVEIKGIITDSEGTLKNLRDFAFRSDVKAVVVRIDSPGGAVGASQEMYEEIRRLDGKKPVVASLATLAASGGYYAALGARHIVADPGTVTGSIGVIMKIPNFQTLLEKLGIRVTVVKSGALKDLGSVTEELGDEERAVLESVMQDIHRQFIRAVAESRQISEEDVVPLADGRIFSGAQALEHRLVDELGNFSKAVDLAAEMAGIDGPPALLYPRKDTFLLLRQFIEQEGAQILVRAFLDMIDSVRERSQPIEM